MGGFRVRVRRERQNSEFRIQNSETQNIESTRCFVTARDIDKDLRDPRLNSTDIVKGIYNWGQLRIIWAKDPSYERPTEFDTKNDPTLCLYVLRKVSK
jgi:hypothetical protein